MPDTENRPFSLLIKPASADCNLDCEYCFYLGHSGFYSETKTHRMSDDVLEAMIKTYLNTEQENYSFGWQGGEPTLMGLDFYKRAVEYQQKFGKPGAVISNGLQTNTTLIDNEFAKFLSEYHFLVGTSLDGPQYIHDHYRKYKNGKGSHTGVIKAIDCMRRNQTEFNILTLVTNYSSDKAVEIYSYLCENGFLFHQYIECVEFDNNGKPLPYTVSGEQWGKFLCDIFDRWIKYDSRRVSVRLFDAILTYMVNGQRIMCTLSRNCRQYFVVEYNGDVYPCDFFVEKELKLGNVMNGSWIEFQKSNVYIDFGKRKSDLNEICRKCKYLKYCAGCCPKNRFYGLKDPKQLSWLCEGWKMFFEHTIPRFEKLAEAIKRDRNPDRKQGNQNVQRNEPCPCGSGLKYKKCCGIDT